jgi:serine/threonine protein kinase
MEQREAGVDVELETWAARLPDAAGREEFRQLIQDADVVSGLLPRQLGPGGLLGGRYRIVRESAPAAGGKVFDAVDVVRGRRIALRVQAPIPPGAAGTDRVFLSRARRLISLRHPGLLPVHEAWRDGDAHVLVTDPLDRPTLAEVLAVVSAAPRVPAAARTRAFAGALGLPVAPRSWWRMAAGLVHDLSVALEAAHARGALHARLHAGSVLLRADGSPVIHDLPLPGDPSREGGLPARGLFSGVAFLAPEQLRAGVQAPDPRTDVYQLGLLLYELLTLQPAFPDEPRKVQLEKIALGDVARPRALEPSVPPALEAVCLRALEVSPERRHPDVAALRDDLGRFLRGGPLARGLRAAGRFLRRHRTAALLAGAPAAALLTRTLAATALWRAGWP